MNSASRGALTLAVLAAAIGELPPAPPRLIVGMPDVALQAPGK